MGNLLKGAVIGAAQLGKSYRNEISPRQGVIRLREFTQATSEYKRLNTNDLSQWLEEYSLGEIWEMNIIGGQPL